MATLARGVTAPRVLIRGLSSSQSAGLPVAILFNHFLDDFVEGITGGAVE